MVEVAHMELAEPSVADAVDAAVAAGAQVVTVAPYFLSRCAALIRGGLPAIADLWVPGKAPSSWSWPP